MRGLKGVLGVIGADMLTRAQRECIELVFDRFGFDEEATIYWFATKLEQLGGQSPVSMLARKDGAVLLDILRADPSFKATTDSDLQEAKLNLQRLLETDEKELPESKRNAWRCRRSYWRRRIAQMQERAGKSPAEGVDK